MNDNWSDDYIRSLEARIAELEADNARLTMATRLATNEAMAAEGRIAELEAELAAFKQMDMDAEAEVRFLRDRLDDVIALCDRAVFTRQHMLPETAIRAAANGDTT